MDDKDVLLGDCGDFGLLVWDVPFKGDDEFASIRSKGQRKSDYTKESSQFELTQALGLLNREFQKCNEQPMMFRFQWGGMQRMVQR